MSLLLSCENRQSLRSLATCLKQELGHRIYVGCASQSRSIGKQLSMADAMIAGHAIALNATLVTDDGRLAAALPEVEVVSWR